MTDSRVVYAVLCLLVALVSLAPLLIDDIKKGRKG